MPHNQETIPVEIIEKAQALATEGWVVSGINPPEVDQEFIDEGFKGAGELFGEENLCIKTVQGTNGKIYTVFLDKKGKTYKESPNFVSFIGH